MKWRPKEGWDTAEIAKTANLRPAWGIGAAIEAGADALLDDLMPVLETVYAQLCGIKMKNGKTTYYSALDSSIDKLKEIIKRG